MENTTFTLKSKGLGGQFNKKHVFNGMGCDGENLSPDLFWEEAPEGTRSFAITLHDPDAPTDSGFWHWAVFNIPATAVSLKEGAGNLSRNLLPQGAFMAKNDYGSYEYGGPCPPEGDFPHAYVITIYALKTEKVKFDKDTPLSQCIFRMKMQEGMLGRASIISYYGK